MRAGRLSSGSRHEAAFFIGGHVKTQIHGRIISYVQLVALVAIAVHLVINIYHRFKGDIL